MRTAVMRHKACRPRRRATLTFCRCAGAVPSEEPRIWVLLSPPTLALRL